MLFPVEKCYTDTIIVEQVPARLERMKSMDKHLTNSKIPAYVGVYNSLYSDIKSGVYPENESLPGEIALSETYGVSRNTLRQSLAILCEDGLIVRSQGRGTIVCARNETDVDGKIHNPMTHLARQKVDGVEIHYNYGAPTDIARAKLGLEKGDIVLASDAVYKVGGEVIGYSFTQVPTAVFNDIGVDATQDDGIDQLVTELIFEHAELWNATFKLVFSNEMESSFLQVEEGHPLVLLEAILHDGARQPFARCKFYFLMEHYQLRFQF